MIRKSVKTDTDKIMRIWLEASRQAHHFVAADFWDGKLAEIRDVYLPRAETFVYEDKRQIKGFISVLADNFIGGLFVAPQHQKRNIGTKLLEYVRQNKANLTLKVYVKNKAALSFYQKKDFKIIAEKQDAATGEAELVMSWARGCKSGFAKKYQGDS